MGSNKFESGLNLQTNVTMSDVKDQAKKEVNPATGKKYDRALLKRNAQQSLEVMVDDDSSPMI